MPGVLFTVRVTDAADDPAGAGHAERGLVGVLVADRLQHRLGAVTAGELADPLVRLVFSLPGRPRGRGKVERYLDTINQMCLAALPGYAPRGTKDRAGQATLSLAELDAALGAFIVTVYNHRVHSETGQPPQARWKSRHLPRLPESLEQLDLLLLTVAKPRKIHPDGIRFQGLRYLDPVLAAYVGETVIIRYDPRDLAEIRVFHRGPLPYPGHLPGPRGQHCQPQGDQRRAQRVPPGTEKADRRARQRRRPADRRSHHRPRPIRLPPTVPAVDQPALRLKRYREE